MKALRKWFFSILIALTLLFGVQTALHADPYVALWISDYSNTIIIYDNMAGDLSPQVGAVSFVGTLGNWDLNVVSAITYPILGSQSNPDFDLSSQNTSSAAVPGSLIVAASALGYNPAPNQGATLTVGGTTKGIVSFYVWTDTENVFFGTDTQIGPLGPFGPGGFSGIISGPTDETPYSMTIAGYIDQRAAGATSFDARGSRAGTYYSSTFRFRFSWVRAFWEKEI